MKEFKIITEYDMIDSVKLVTYEIHSENLD